MRKIGSLSGRKWASIAGVGVCLLLFQNMSFLSEDVNQPAAEINRPPDDFSQYVPNHPHGDSPGAIANEILDHNFGSYFRGLTHDLEEKYGHWLKPSLEIGGGDAGDQASGDSVGTGTSPIKTRSPYAVSLLNVGTLGFSYDGDVRLRCEYSIGSRALQVSLNKNLSARSALFVRHSTEDQRTNVSYSYRW